MTPAASRRRWPGASRGSPGTERLHCEIVLVLGDRIEAFAGACAAVTGRRVLVHIHGGDRGVGDVDDVLRNAITRMRARSSGGVAGSGQSAAGHGRRGLSHPPGGGPRVG